MFGLREDLSLFFEAFLSLLRARTRLGEAVFRDSQTVVEIVTSRLQVCALLLDSLAPDSFVLRLCVGCADFGFRVGLGSRLRHEPSECHSDQGRKYRGNRRPLHRATSRSAPLRRRSPKLLDSSAIEGLNAMRAGRSV